MQRGSFFYQIRIVQIYNIKLHNESSFDRAIRNQKRSGLAFWRYITSCLACMEIDIKENNFLQKIAAHVSRHVE